MYIFGDKYRLKNNKNIIEIKVKKIKALIIEFVFKPKAYILIISLSLCNFKNDNIKPNIITIGNITVIKLGIKKIVYVDDYGEVNKCKACDYKTDYITPGYKLYYNENITPD